MALLERIVILKRKSDDGNTYMEFPITTVNAVEGAVATVNGVVPDTDGNVTITSVTKATQDGSGNVIASTYATKTELSDKADSSHTHTISDVTNLQTTLNGKASLASPTFTGTPKAPTATAGTNTTQVATTAFVTTAINNKTSVTKATQDGSGNVITSTYATKTEVTEATDAAKAYTDTAISNLVDSAPDTLNTLGELATALQDNEDVVTTLNSAIGNKANSSDVVNLTGNQTIVGTKTFSSTIAGSISGNAATASKLGTDAGSATQPVYFANGIPVATTYTLGASVPSGAKFTDTTYSAMSASEATTGTATTARTITAKVLNDKITEVVDANAYTHPSYTAKSSGLYKVTVDATGHVSATTAVTKADITGLGIPAQDTVYSLPTASSSTLGGVKTTSTVTSTSGLTACPIISGVPYYKDTNTTYTLSSFGLTATATELNYCDGVTSNIQTQLNGKLSTSGTAAKATADASGNVITTTYATKAELDDLMYTVSTRERGADEPTYGLE